jgi:hypothetical protein
LRWFGKRPDGLFVPESRGDDIRRYAVNVKASLVIPNGRLFYESKLEKQLTI